MTKDLKSAKYIVWSHYESEGWSPTGFETLNEALLCDTYGQDKLITSGEVKFEATEIK